jgi:hypothetical protein
MRRTWLTALVLMAGCGGAEQSGASTASSTSELSRLRAELGAGPTQPVIALGDDLIIVPASVFGTSTDIVARFLFLAIREPSGQVRGRFRVSEAAEGSTFHYSGPLTCAGVYDFNGLTGNRAKVGGRIDATDDTSVGVGSFIWWQAIDNHGLHRPDQSTLAGFGDEAANEAFCQSSNPPRFGPFDVVRGNIVVGPGGNDDGGEDD